MTFIRRVYLRWKFRNDPRLEMLDQYNTLIKLSRRCAYDLRHAVDFIPSDHYSLESFGLYERADHWIALFAKGNPGKDYRHELQMRVMKLEHQLDELHQWCQEKGLSPPDNRDYTSW